MSGGYTLITGGAGFIGTNLAARLLRQGKRVLIYDNLSREGVERNLDWLFSEFSEGLDFQKADVRDEQSLREAVRSSEAVFHLAAQVAVTSSLDDPIHDFEVNARGTLNLLEALRERKDPPPLLYTSTNKVLGGMERLEVTERSKRYEPTDPAILKHGIGDGWGIEFCSPYGCSKGAADQYVLDYAKNFGLPAVVFRMSCIYGPHQCGNEDQGWVAHFVKQAIASLPVTFYGDGKQVRDALFVEDLIDAFLLAHQKIDRTRGRAFNIGGGVDNTVSLVELVEKIADAGTPIPEIRREPWRPSDQRYYVSDIRAFHETTGWAPKVPFDEGLQQLHDWTTKTAPVTDELT